MDLALAAHPAFLALCALAAGVLAAWSYARSTPRVHGWRRGVLTALRFGALFLVLFLLFEPVWTRLTRSSEPPLVAVLVDASQSLTLAAGGRSPAAQVRAAVAGLPDDAALRFYTFDGEAHPRGTHLPPDSLVFAGDRTDLSGALARVEADFAGRNLRAVVLVSDGRVTAGRNPAYLAERFPVPVFTAVAGDSVSSRDVRMARVATNEIAYAGSPLPVQAGVRATGFEGQTASVTLTDGGRIVGRTTVALPSDGAEAVVDLTVTPATPGLRRYTVSVGPMGGEATTRNNSRSATVRVVSDRRRVLVVAAAPSPDLAALRASLDADRSLDVTVRTQRAPGQFYEGALPALGPFDLLILAGYPGRAASDADASRLAAAARGGLPVAFLLTQSTDLARLAGAFGDVLPAVPQTARPGFVEGQLAPTSAGEAHPVLDDLGATPARLGALPPLAISPSRWALQPGAQVLATVRRGSADTGAPLLVVRQSGAVRSAALLGAGSWRWKTLPDDLGDLRPVYGALWDRLIRWTTATRDRRPVRVRPDRQLFGERERVTFTGQVYGENLAPVSDATIRLTVRGPGGARAPVAMRNLGNGRYAADVGVQPSGTYTFAAEATRGGASLGSDRGTFGVGRLAVEFREPGADPSLMRQIALRSGGQTVGLDTLGAFVRSLRDRGDLTARPLVREDATPLLTLPWLLGLAVFLLAAEWVLRKRSGMV